MENAQGVPAPNDQIAELRDAWRYISPIEQVYYYAKARYLTMSKYWLAAAIVAILGAIGVLVYALRQNIIVSIAVIVIGIILGVIVVWEIERPR